MTTEQTELKQQLDEGQSGIFQGDLWDCMKNWLLWHTGDAGRGCCSLLLFNYQSSDPKFDYGIDLADIISFKFVYVIRFYITVPH